MRIRRHVLRLEPYTPGKSKEELAREYGVEPDEIVKLGSNENPLGPPPRAVEAAERELRRLHEYPEPLAPPELFDAIREYLADPPYPAGEPVDVTEDRLIVGGDGADEIIDLLVRITVDPGDTVLTLAPTFSQYGVSTRAAGGSVRHVPLDPERGFQPDEDRLFEALEDVRIAFLCTPNNPTGNALPERLVRDAIEECPGVVLIDHAYVEFADHDYTPLALEYDNVLVLRTCSKALGLAGARVGYAVADPELIEHLRRVKPVFSLTRPSAAAATAALRDREHVRRTVDLVRRERERLRRRINGLPGPRAYPSEANYLFVDVGPAGTDAPTFTEELLRRGVIIRDCSTFEGLDEPRYVRVSVGLPEENDRFVEAAREALESLQSG